MPVRIERSGPVTTIVLSRPEARNAVDGPTAQELIQAFEEFDADESASVAVLWGEGGTFCSGADLKALGTPRSNHATEHGDGVDAEEALNIGLITRVVPVGRARSEAEALAAELALLPQTCMREDRLSLLEQDGLDEESALKNEFRHGAISINADALSGASRFASGAGRHGTASP